MGMNRTAVSTAALVAVSLLLAACGLGDSTITADAPPDPPMTSRIQLDDDPQSQEWVRQEQRDLRATSEALGLPELTAQIADDLARAWREYDGTSVPVDLVGRVLDDPLPLHFCIPEELPPSSFPEDFPAVQCRFQVPILDGVTDLPAGLVRARGTLTFDSGRWGLSVPKLSDADRSEFVPPSPMCEQLAKAPEGTPPAISLPLRGPELDRETSSAFSWELGATLSDVGAVAASVRLVPGDDRASWSWSVTDLVGAPEFAASFARLTGMDVLLRTELTDPSRTPTCTRDGE